MKKILALLTILLILCLTFSILLPQVKAEGTVLVKQWNYKFGPINYFETFCPSPAVANLLGGPELEIVTGTDEWHGYQKWHCFNYAGTDVWTLPTGVDESRSSVAIADIDGDGDLEIIGGTTSGWQLQVITHDGKFVWKFSDGYAFWRASPAVADLRPDISGLEIVAATYQTQRVWCFDKSGNVLWSYFIEGGYAYSTPAIGDIDNDGELDIVVGATNGKAYCFNKNGGVEWTYTPGAAIFSSAAIANLDADVYLEVVIGSNDGKIYCLDGKTASVQWAYETGGAVYSSPSFGDVDADGSYEIIVGSDDSKIYCLGKAGTLEWSYATGGAVRSSASLANRGTTGLGIYIGSMDKYLYLIDGKGTLIDRFYTGATNGITSSPAIADVDGDGKLEVMFTDWNAIPNSWETTNYFWCLEDTGSKVGKYAIEWQVFRHDARRTGLYTAIPDLALIGITPIQVIYEASALILGKPTLIKVEIKSTFPNDITTKIKITWDGQLLREDLTIPASTTSIFHLSSTQFIVFTETGTRNISVEIDPENVITESDETNNKRSLNVLVKDTKGFSILYAFVRMPIIVTMADSSSEFIRATYPVSPGEVTYSTERYDWMCVPCWPILQPIDLLLDLAVERVLSGKDYAVGVIPQWCADEIMPGAAGIMSPLIPGSAVVVTNYYTAAAHEIGHHLDIRKWPWIPEEYQEFPPNGKWVSGYWVTHRESMETYCFMGRAAAPFSSNRWVCKDDYEYLLNKLKSSPSDPELLFVSGLLFRNGTTQLRTWYRMPNGVPDLQPDGVGNYSIVCLDAQGQLLSQVWFNATFEMRTESPREFDSMGFAFTIPYPEGTSTILLTHDGITIGERIVSANSPEVKVIYPNGGEVFWAGKTVTIRWVASDPDKDTLTYSVLYSLDGGKSLIPLVIDLQNQSLDWIVPEGITSDKALIKVVASDGVNVEEDSSDAVFTIWSPPTDKLSMAEYTKLELQRLTTTIEKVYDIKEDVEIGLIDKLTNATKKVDQAIKWIKLGKEKEANDMLDAAENIINAFINQVEAQSGKGIMVYDALGLIFDAQEIIKDIKAAKQMKL